MAPQGAASSWGHSVETIDFFKRVCPRTDKIVVTQYINNKDIFWNRATYSYDELEQAAADVLTWDKHPQATIYFGVGSFANHEVLGDDGKIKYKRTQELATFFRAICFDLDCGVDKPYATQQEGLQALASVTKELGLPKPMVVLSGNGAHVYWVLAEDIPKTRWVEVSSKLREAFAKHELYIDNSKIHDPSMVLRPVGTHHKKAEPWKQVRTIIDDGLEHDIALFEDLLKDYTVPVRTTATKRKRSAILDAILNDRNDLDVDVIGSRCQQVAALLASGGVTDAAGNPVDEPLWRASLGIAKFTPDPEAAIIKLAGKHPGFDLQENLEKLEGWRGTGPTTCDTFAQLCPKGCEGCPYAGKQTSPASLSGATKQVIPQLDQDAPEQEIEVELPNGYVIRRGRVYQEVEEEDENGNTVKDFKHVSAYPMFVKSVFFDTTTRKSSFTLVVRKPITGWEEADHPMSVLATSGKDFSAFLIDNQLFGFNSTNQQEKLRWYLMDYLKMVQEQVGTGYDYQNFGWQDDGSFVCGDRVINAANGNSDRRITGNARAYLDRVCRKGSREGFVEAMSLLRHAGTNVIRSAILIATTGVIAKYMGNGSSIVSIYSTETTTGKTLSLLAVNSLIGHPRALLQGRNDTANAIFGMRGALNNLPMCIDEMTMMDDTQIANMAYSFSEGQEKTAMNQKREIREAARWSGPTFMTTNSSLLAKYSNVMQQSEPMRVRTFEMEQNDRTFVGLRLDDQTRISDKFGNLLLQNYGWAYPELVEAVVALGGPEEVAKKGAADFVKNFDFEFEPQERFYESMVKSAWTMGKIGKGLGLFTFDVKGTVNSMLENVLRLRKATRDSHIDAIDVIGQFMQEYNDQIIEVTQEYGVKDAKPHVTLPAPLKAVMRAHYVYDKGQPIMPGSSLAINKSVFRQYLKAHNDAEDRVIRELAEAGALLAERERVTMFKNCRGRNPGQAWCIMVNLNHPRFVSALSGSEFKKQSSVTLAVLDGLQEGNHGQ